MKLRFKQKMFSWFDSYDVFNDGGETVFQVKGALAWGHLLKIYDAAGNPLGQVKQKVLTWLPKFELYLGDQYIGCIHKEFTFFKPRFTVECNGWQVEGNFMEWDYTVLDVAGNTVASVSKELFQWTDTYVIYVDDPKNALQVLMLVLAIDAEKCSRKNR